MPAPLPTWTRIRCKGCSRCAVLTDAWMRVIGGDYFGRPEMRALPYEAVFRLHCTRCNTVGRIEHWPPEQDKGKAREKLQKAVYERTSCRRCGGWGCSNCRR